MKTLFILLFTVFTWSVNAAQVYTDSIPIKTIKQQTNNDMPPPPPPPPPPEPEVEEIFQVMEQSPYFKHPDCEKLSNWKEREKCGEEAMYAYVYEHLNYPKEALQKGVEGMVIIQYLIRKDGAIREVIILQDIGNGCGEEAQRIVQSFPKFKALKARSRNVEITRTISIEFNRRLWKKHQRKKRKNNKKDLKKVHDRQLRRLTIDGGIFIAY